MEPVHLSGLPAEKGIEVVILERAGASEEVQAWLRDIRERHPFATMEKEQILKVLRETREEVWVERHEG